MAAQISFDPELADNYEVGFKSQLLDNSLQLNATYFYIEFDDLQLTERIDLIPGDPTSSVQAIFNAAAAEIQGTELEVLWLPPRRSPSLDQGC